MADFNRNLWAPWRMAYIRTLAEERDAGCFLCRYASDPARDAEHFVVWRDGTCLAVLNRFPYVNGHLMVAPLRHEGEFERLNEAELTDSVRLLRRSAAALRTCLGAQGFNIGMNLGQCAGAGLPGHVHWHVVPRWSGDTNYVSVIGDARVIPESLEENWRALTEWTSRQTDGGGDRP